MAPEERALRTLMESRHTLDLAIEVMAPSLAQGARLLTDTLLADGRVLCCGNGGSAALAQHFVAALLNRFRHERPGLSAIALAADAVALTSIAADHGYEQVFARQVRALGRPGDTLMVLDADGGADNLVAATEAARERGLGIIALTGRGGGVLPSLLDASDVELPAPGDNAARAQEIHLVALHCLCDLIDARLLGLEQ